MKEVGGLAVIGTERHESRRIDNQLRGRSGRQGDPGLSRFYVSLEDDLMRIFGSDRLKDLMTKLGMEEGEVIYHPWVSKAIERSQKAVDRTSGWKPIAIANEIITARFGIGCSGPIAESRWPPGRELFSASTTSTRNGG